MALPHDFIERVKDANRIDDVMRQYTALKRSGHGYKCLCPFHSEKTPSCQVYTDSQSFYCFGCGAGGDVITFTMKSENLDSVEAVIYLAEKSGIPVPENDYADKNADRRKRLYEMNREAAKFFYSALKTEDGKEGLAYLIQRRKLKPETIKAFGLGVADNHWTSLTNHMLSLGYTKEELISASLITEKNGRCFDFFMNRVMFPIFDLRGNVIAFSGRTLEKESKGMKYLNSRGTPVYEKTRTLFALNFAKNESVKSKRLILCEGNLDVISLHQAGFTEAVATCGTAITADHARLMAQYCDEVYICYDSDQAGQKATASAISILSAAGLKSKVVKISGDGVKDVDDYINKFGPDHFKLLLTGSDGAIEYSLEKCKLGLDLDTDTGKVEYLKRAVEVLCKIESKIEREIYISRVAAEQSVPKTVLASEVSSTLSKQFRSRQSKEWKAIATGRQPRDDINPEAQKHPALAKAEEGIIAYLMRMPENVDTVLKDITPQDFATSFNRRIFATFAELNAIGAEISLSAIGSAFSADEMGRISKIIAKNREIVIDDATLKAYINLLKKPRPEENAEISDDDLLKLQQELAKQKK